MQTRNFYLVPFSSAEATDVAATGVVDKSLGEALAQSKRYRSFISKDRQAKIQTNKNCFLVPFAAIWRLQATETLLEP